MTPESLLAQFDVMAEAPNGIEKLRELVLQLAVRGKLVPQDPADEPASVLLERIEDWHRTTSGNASKRRSPSTIPDNECPFPLAKGWQFARLEQLVQFEYGKNLPAGKREASGSIPVYGSNGIVGSHSESLFEVPSIVVGRKGSAGALNLTTGPGWVTDVAYFVVLPTELDVRFAFRLLQALRLDQLGKGIKPGLSRSEAYNLVAVLPPLAEQYRIVAKIDELMALCDQLEARQGQRAELRAQLNHSTLHALTSANGDAEVAEQWQQLSEHFDLSFDGPEVAMPLRKAILELAMEGRLATQREGDGSASVILHLIESDRKQQNDRTHRLHSLDESAAGSSIPDSWVRVRAGELLSFITSGSRGWAAHYSDSGALFLRIGNLDYDSIDLDLRSIQRVAPPAGAEGSRTKVQPGDVLISITGDTGMVGLVPSNFEEAYINQHIALARPSGHIDPEWFARYCTSAIATAHFFGTQRGIKNSLGLDDIRSMPVLLPPLAEQHRIVARVDELMALCDALEARLTSAREHATQLAAAIVLRLTAA